MNLYVGNTDFDWYQQLSTANAGEANFWKPGTSTFKALPSGGMFLFKLKSPHNRIVGGGHFLRFIPMTVSEAWRSYELANGVQGFFEFRDRILRLMPNRAGEVDPEIGCVLLAECFWFPYDDAIEVPESYKLNIVQGRRYNIFEEDGRRLYDQVRARLATEWVVADERAAYGAPYEARARLGQGGFRAMVTDCYERRCVITGERTLPVLEAAHIKPYELVQRHEVTNGLLLRADLHRLFDDHLITVTEKHVVEVSPSIKDRWENGKDYYKLHGQLIRLPKDMFAAPDPEMLQWHNERFVQ